MQSLTRIRAISLALCGSLLFAGSAPVFAQHAGGHFGGFRGGGFHGGGFRGGYYGGFRGGYGYRGYGYRGYGGFWGPWGLGWGGLGLGLYFASLPYYYQTYWWGGVPYYYADNTYYRWNGGVGQYETVAPPSDAQNQGGAGGSGGVPSGSSELMAYPKNGQSQEQQGKDKYECHHWAAGQAGFDPSQGAAAGPVSRRSDYMRAQAACLEGRGYSVR